MEPRLSSVQRVLDEFNYVRKVLEKFRVDIFVLFVLDFLLVSAEIAEYKKFVRGHLKVAHFSKKKFPRDPL